MSFRNLSIVGLLLVLVMVGGWFFMASENLEKNIKNTPKPTPVPTVLSEAFTPSPTPSQTASASASPTASAEQKIVAITDKGFTPKSTKIKAGDSVIFMNTGQKTHQINSSPHPSHDDSPFLNKIGLLKPKDQKTIEFEEKGVYKFHDHFFPSYTGTITVE